MLVRQVKFGENFSIGRTDEVSVQGRSIVRRRRNFRRGKDIDVGVSYRASFHSCFAQGCA